VLNVTASG